MGTPPVSRPLSVAALLQRTLDVVGRNAGLLVRCVIIVVAPLVVVAGAVAGLAIRDGGQAFDVGVSLMTVAAALGQLVAIAACVHVIVRVQGGATATVSTREALGFGFRWLPAVLGVSIVCGVAVFAGIIAFIVPGIYLLVRWAMVLPAMLVEDGRPFAALERSAELVRGRWWTVFGLLLAGYLIPAVVAAVVQQGILGLSGLATAPRTPEALVGQGVAQIIGTCISLPFTTAFLVLVYFELRTVGPVAAAPVAPGAWPPPAPPRVGASPVSRPAPVPPPPPTGVPGAPLPGGFLPPAPSGAPPAALPRPPERPPGAGDPALEKRRAIP